MLNKENKNIIGNYKFIKTIGEGTFGKVKLSIHIPTKEYVAIKILEKSRIHDKEELERVEKEIKYLKLLNHPNIIQIYEVIDNPKYFYIVMEYVSGGELFNYIVNNEKLDEKEASFFFSQLIHGIKEIHKKKICHRDIKPENLLLTEKKLIKIIDFGLSNEYENYLKTQCGSPCYAAPEMIKGMKYNGLMIDLWACGIILFAMLCGYLPFDDKDNNILFRKILQCKVEFPNEKETYLSNEAKDLILRILTPNPSKRIQLEEILNHPFLISGNQEYKNIMKPIIFNQEKIVINYMVNKLKYSNEDNLIFKLIKENKHNNYTTTYKLLKKKIIEGRFDYNYIKDKQSIKYISPIKNFKIKININNKENINNQRNDKDCLRKGFREKNNSKNKINKSCSMNSNKNNYEINDLNIIKNKKVIEDKGISPIKNNNLMIKYHKRIKPIYHIILSKNNNFKRKIDTSVSIDKQHNRRINQKIISKTPIKINVNPFAYEKDSINIYEYNNNRKKIFYIPKDRLINKKNEISVDRIKNKKNRYNPNIILGLKNLKIEQKRNGYALTPPISQIKNIKNGLSSERVDKKIIKYERGCIKTTGNIYRKYYNNDSSKRNRKEHKEIISDLSTNISLDNSLNNINYKRIKNNEIKTIVNGRKNNIINKIDQNRKSPNNYINKNYNTIQINKVYKNILKINNRSNNNTINANINFNTCNCNLYNNNNNIIKNEKNIKKVNNDKAKLRNTINNNNEIYTPLKKRVKNNPLNQMEDISYYQQKSRIINLKNDIYNYKNNNSLSNKNTLNNRMINQQSRKEPYIINNTNLNIKEIKYKLIGFCNKNNFDYNEFNEFKYLILINNSDSFILEIGYNSTTNKSKIFFYHNSGSEGITKKNMAEFFYDINKK